MEKTILNFFQSFFFVRSFNCFLIVIFEWERFLIVEIDLMIFFSVDLIRGLSQILDFLLHVEDEEFLTMRDKAI